jgi:predicted Zn-dependent protease with MMP-like domain
METSKFEQLVRQALNELPNEFHSRMENVDIVVEDHPTRDQLIGSGLDEDECLLGLYEGIPLPDRYNYDLVLPDKITLFQVSIESMCETEEDVIREIQDTVVHEVAHHFGIDDDDLDAMGAR